MKKKTKIKLHGTTFIYRRGELLYDYENERNYKLTHKKKGYFQARLWDMPEWSWNYFPVQGKRGEITRTEEQVWKDIENQILIGN